MEAEGKTGRGCVSRGWQAPDHEESRRSDQETVLAALAGCSAGWSIVPYTREVAVSTPQSCCVQSMFLSHTYLSPSLSLPLSPINICSGEDLKKRESLSLPWLGSSVG